MTLPFATAGGDLLPLARSLWVYAGVLFVDALALPMASSVYVAALGAVHPPLAVATVGAAATTLGSLAQYAGVRWLMTLAPRRDGALHRLRLRLERAVRAAPSATAAALFLVYATPLSAGPLRLIAAVTGYSPWRFALAIGLGCLPYYYALAVLGHLVHVPLWVVLPAIAIVCVAGVVHAMRRWRATAP